MPNKFLTLIATLLSLLILTSCSSTSTFLQQITGGSNAPAPTRAQLYEDAFWVGDANVIWDRLQHIPLKKLEAEPAPSNATRAAWIKLAIISKRYNNDSKQLIQQLTAWRAENPNHPANSLFSNNGTIQSIANNPGIRHIALLLPLQGQMGSSGQAVRDGFLSAYYQSLTKNQAKQTISFYDTSANTNISSLYQQAVNKGANVVVGPLMKEDVQSLLNSGSFNVPTLALNYTDENSLPNNFYEFGLSQGDEAQQIADKAWQSGRSRALVIVAQNAWGQKVSNSLVSRWKSLGGKVSDTLSYSTQTDFNQAVPDLLHVNAQKKQTENNKTKLEQQRRQDFDVIFLLAEPQSARTIVPLLRYYYADNIPIYSTSVIYSGSPDPRKDTDLNGVIFADIPWLLRSSHSTSRLYAVGRDAFAISNELTRLTNLPNFPLYGATGALTITASHKIYRRLPTAQIRNGHP